MSRPLVHSFSLYVALVSNICNREVRVRAAGRLTWGFYRGHFMQREFSRRKLELCNVFFVDGAGTLKLEEMLDMEASLWSI